MRSATPIPLSRSTRLVALTLLPCAWGLACQKRAEIDIRMPVQIDGDRDWSLATHPALPLTGGDLHDLLNQALRATGRYNPAESADPSQISVAAHAYAQVIWADVAADEGATSVDLRVRLQFVSPLADESSAIEEVTAGKAKGSFNEAARTAVSAALATALDRVTADLRGRGKSDQELVADMRGNDPAIAELAIDRLAARRKSVVYAPLIERLRSTDPDISQRALASLVSLDDKRAVRPIIEEAERRALTYKLEALYAIGSLGGEDAEAYLDTVSSETDARIHSAAGDALALAHRRTAAP